MNSQPYRLQQPNLPPPYIGFMPREPMVTQSRLQARLQRSAHRLADNTIGWAGQGAHAASRQLKRSSNNLCTGRG
jgi:hypothetical protein